MRRVSFGTVLATVVACLELAVVGVASGTFPGTNAEIAFAAHGDIWVVDADGSDLHTLIASPRTDRHPAWSPDGSTLAFTRIHDNGDADIYLADADGTNVRRFADSRNDDSQPAWSPDGDAIVFVRAYTAANREGTDLVARSLDGHDHHRITQNGRSVEAAPAWMDGYIAWVSRKIHEVCASPLDDLNDDIRICRVIGYGYAQTSLSFAPGSRLLAYGARVDFGSEFDIVAARFGEDDNLTSSDGYRVDHSPTWSPDGSQIAFVGLQGGEAVLAVMSSAGTGVHEILTSADVEGISWPSWRSMP
jgi:Tol biopolymer transport system component